MMDLLNDTWMRLRDSLARDLGDRAFTLWFRDVRVLGLARSVLTLETPTPDARAWIAQNYSDLVARRASEAIGAPVRVELRVARDAVSANDDDEIGGPSRVFSTFLATPRSEICLRILRWTAAGRSPSFSPVVIFGSEGVGKSHLASAVVAAASFSDRALLLTADAFTARFTASMKVRRLAEFRDSLLRHRLLVIDGVEQLASRAATARELGSHLQALHAQGGRAVVMSRHHPNEINGLDARLVSMLVSGYTTLLDAPGHEERCEIIRSVMRRAGRDLSTDVVHAIVSSESTSIARALRITKKMVAVAAAFGEPLDPAFVEKHRPGATGAPDPRSRAAETAIGIVCDRFQVDTDAVRSKRKIPVLAIPREVIVWVLREHAGMTLREVGSCLGGRSHTSIHIMQMKFAARMATDAGLTLVVEEVARRLGSVEG